LLRALLNDPELILADEPTGNLDPQTSTEVLEVLRKINENGKNYYGNTHYALLMKFLQKTKCEDTKSLEVQKNRVMLSILIPIYNFNAVPLVKRIAKAVYGM
jgi:cell division transport system ATP-binding protein